MLNLKRSVAAISTGLIILAAGLTAAETRNRFGPPTVSVSCSQVLVDYFKSLPVNTIDTDTLDAIIFLREEEKLARDLYLTMASWYDIPIFSNIAISEQHHMDLAAKLIKRYSPDYDPVEGNGIGEFTDPIIQGFFDDWKEWGRENPIEGLRVGVRVEDIDIYDLENILDLSEDYDDISMIVQNMIAGSRNHMRSFTKVLEKRDADYEIVYIPELIEGILTSPMETAVIYDENGDVLAECGLSGGLEP